MLNAGDSAEVSQPDGAPASESSAEAAAPALQDQAEAEDSGQTAPTDDTDATPDEQGSDDADAAAPTDPPPADELSARLTRLESSQAQMQSERDRAVARAEAAEQVVTEIQTRAQSEARERMATMDPAELGKQMQAEITQPPSPDDIRAEQQRAIFSAGLANAVEHFEDRDAAVEAFQDVRDMAAYNAVVLDLGRKAGRADAEAARNAGAARRVAAAPQVPAGDTAAPVPTPSQLETRLADPTDDFGTRDEDWDRYVEALPEAERAGLVA